MHPIKGSMLYGAARGPNSPCQSNVCYPYAVNIDFSGMSLGSYAPTSNIAAMVTLPSFVAMGSTGVLTFTGISPALNDSDVLLDNVRLQSTLAGSGPGAVPEPASWAMLICGFGMMGAGMRYKRRRAVVRHALA